MNRNIRIAKELMRLANEINAAASKKTSGVGGAYLHFDGKTSRFVYICDLYPSKEEEVVASIADLKDAASIVKRGVDIIMSVLKGAKITSAILHGISMFGIEECVHQYLDDFRNVIFRRGPGGKGGSITDILRKAGIDTTPQADEVLDRIAQSAPAVDDDDYDGFEDHGPFTA